MLNFISTMKCIRQLVDVSRLYGSDKDYVLGSGGNTSFKDEKFMWIKASGTALETIVEESFVVLDRAKLKSLIIKRYSEYPDEREKQIKRDLHRSCVYREQQLQPSLETLFHEIINYNFVVHTHPTLVNALMCSMDAKMQTSEMFGDKALYVPYTNPGYLLFKRVEAHIVRYRETFQADPHVIFLQNHGVFVAADSIDEIKEWHSQIDSAIQSYGLHQPDTTPLPVSDSITHLVPAIRMTLTEKSPRTVIFRHHQLIKRFYETQESFRNVAAPLTPEAVLYYNARPLYIAQASSPDDMVKEIVEKIESYKRQYKCSPNIVVVGEVGCFSISENYKLAEIALDVFEDQMKISALSERFGGPKFLTDGEIEYINHQAMDNIQRLLQTQETEANSLAGKTVVFIGKTDQLAVGLLEDMMAKNMNLVVVSPDDETCRQTLASLASKTRENHAVFVNSTDAQWVSNLITETMKHFGGIDVVIQKTNTDETAIPSEPALQGLLEILKRQAGYKKEYFTDMIMLQVQDSKDKLSGLALELLPYRTKINTIVVNAASHQGTQAPLGRNCETKDVLRAIYYLIDQQYETGLQLYVTGGAHLMH